MSGLAAAIRMVVRRACSAAALAEALASPWLRLAVRIWLAQAFLVAGLMDMMSGHGLHAQAWLSQGWWAVLMQQAATSGLGVAVQAACPILLALGLLTRPAAIALLLQAVFLPLPGAGQDAPLFWIALLSWLVVFGAGPLSLDRLLRPGLESSAVPAAAAIGRSFAWFTGRAGPIYRLALRVWLAAAPAGVALAALGITPAMQPGLAPWLPQMPSMVAGLTPWMALMVAALLAAGLATRIAAGLLLLLVPVSQLMPGSDVRLYWALVLAVHAVDGAGPWSIDALICWWARRSAVPSDERMLPHVVVVGGGFGGIAVVRGLASTPCRVTLIDQRNHHLFQPLLYQVATASLAPGDIATPIRAMFRGQANTRVLLGRITGVDVPGKAVLLDGGRIAYDTLVLATGAQHSYFGRNDWAPLAPGLKTVEDSTAIRRRLLLAFEEAENASSAAEQRAWLTFVIVGGGPTGVELAGSIAELARHGLAQEFRFIDPASAHVILVQSGDRLLPAFPEPLSREAERALQRLGVDVRLDHRVEDITAEGAMVSGQTILAKTVLWAAGVEASPAAAWLGVPADRAGRVPVGPEFGVAGCDGVYAIGDTAASVGWNGKPVPGLAPAAKQGGAYVARAIRAKLNGRRGPRAFRYRHLGSLATIGRQSAVADFGLVRLRGAVAWWLWGAVHIAFLVGGRSRVTVLIQWLWAYLTLRRGTRLITGVP